MRKLFRFIIYGKKQTWNPVKLSNILNILKKSI